MNQCTKNNQLLLKKFGYDPGPIDGIDGRRTQHAIAEALDEGPSPDRDHAVVTPKSDREAETWPRQTNVEDFYGKPGTGHASVDCPYPLRIAWDLDKTINRFTINKLCAASAKRVMVKVLDHYGADQINELGLNLFGGCYNNRNMRGGSRKSMHAYACAIDWDPIRNRLKWGRNRAQMARVEYAAWWELWEEEGWISLGRTRNFDWMHVQAVRL